MCGGEQFGHTGDEFWHQCDRLSNVQVVSTVLSCKVPLTVAPVSSYYASLFRQSYPFVQ